MPRTKGLSVIGLLLFAAAAGGCAVRQTERFVQEGEFGKARDELACSLEQNAADRNYMIDRMRLAIVDICDGQFESPEKNINDIYEFLRTQGVNDDKTVEAVVVTEGVRRWKGEPFEQALMFAYTAVYKAMRGELDNARAAALNSLFLLRDFGEVSEGEREGQRKWTQDIVASVEDEKALASSYTARNTNFALGHLLAGAFNSMLGAGDADRDGEAEEHYGAALVLAPQLGSVIEKIRNRDFNTLLVVTYGLGPTKYCYGEDCVYAAFRQLRNWESDYSELQVQLDDSYAQTFPTACDVNFMAQDHMWNNLEDVRITKSVLGTAMVYSGAAAMSSGNRNAQIVGAALVIAGAIAKASARADTRHCEIVPQRIYVAPVKIERPNTSVAVQVGDNAVSRLVLPGLSPPAEHEPFQVRLVSIPPTWAGLPWMSSGKVLYANDRYSAPVEGDTLPYILGGTCVRRPTQEVLEHYQKSGYLEGVSLGELEDLYRGEGIALNLDEELQLYTKTSKRSKKAETDRVCGLHVLEGGSSLECPLPGTTGFVRLFCQQRPAYVPRSAKLREFIASGKVGGPVQVATVDSGQ